MNQISRRSLLAGAAALAASGCLPRSTAGGLERTDVDARAQALLERITAADAHAHPGLTFLRDAPPLPESLRVIASGGPFEARAVEDMRAGGLALCAFAAVADLNVLDLSRERGLYAHREFEPGEAQASYRTQIANLQKLVDDGLVRRIDAPADVTAAAAAGEIGAIFTVEGGDFLEGSVQRLHEAYADGVRSVTILHYHANDLGDVMTAAPAHGTLTQAGETIVREMNALGMLIDLAHADEASARRTLDITSRPVMFSHTHINSPTFSHPRFITADLARACAEAGGVIGAWPAGLGISDMEGFIDRIFELVDVVGVDHVCLGTDMDANYMPVMDNYRQLPELTAALLNRGIHEAEVEQILGSNFLRVFASALTPG